MFYHTLWRVLPQRYFANLDVTTLQDTQETPILKIMINSNAESKSEIRFSIFFTVLNFKLIIMLILVFISWHARIKHTHYKSFRTITRINYSH